MSKCRTYVDANILISAFNGNEVASLAAIAVLNDPKKEFVISDYLRLEIIPKPFFNKREEEVAFMEAFFQNAMLCVPPSEKVISKALDFACRYNLKSLDALHISAASEAQVDEFWTLENEKRKIHKVKEIKVRLLPRI